MPIIGGVSLNPDALAYKGILKDGAVAELKEASEAVSPPELAKRADALIDPADHTKGLKTGCTAFTILYSEGKWIPVGSPSFGNVLSLDENARKALETMLE